MKIIVFFDVDNTIYNNALGIIPSQTVKLIKKLNENENVLLGLATGRGLKKLEVITEILPYFTFKVLVNGAAVMIRDELIFDEPIKNEDIIEILEKTKNKNFNVGMVGINNEAVNYWDDRVGYGMKALRGIFPKVDPYFYQKEKIYQLWMFADYESEILEIAKELPKFQALPWHRGGADFTYPHIDKAFGIKKALEQVKDDYKLVCVGDGYNDIKMIEMADVGIAMDNTRFIELKEKAIHIAPAITEDKMYDFFKSLKLFDL